MTQLFLSLQSRPDTDIDFFQLKIHRDTQSPADQGLLQLGKKSDIFQWLNVPNECAEAAKHVAVVVLNMAAVIHMVRPTIAKTFDEYVQLNVEPYLEAQIHSDTERINTVRDNSSSFYES